MMILTHEFTLKNTEQEIAGEVRSLSFEEDEGKLFRYKDFTAMQAERFAYRLFNLIPESTRKTVQEIAEDSSKYDAMSLLMSDEDFIILSSTDCIDFLNSELFRFEMYNKQADIYEPLTIEKIDTEITSISTLVFLRTKLLKAFKDFFTKGDS